MLPPFIARLKFVTLMLASANASASVAFPMMLTGTSP
jgi:hypothetical protein